MALDAIMEVNSWCEVIDFANKEIQECCLLMKNNAKYKDLEDTIQYVMAKKVSAELILSNDKGFVSDDITLMSSETYLSSLVVTLIDSDNLHVEVETGKTVGNEEC